MRNFKRHCIAGIIGYPCCDYYSGRRWTISWLLGMRLSVSIHQLLSRKKHNLSQTSVGGNVVTVFCWSNCFVCFITKSFLTYSFVLPTPTLSTVCRPLSSYVCSITSETANVGSSYSHMRGPGVGCWFSYRSNCSHWNFEAAVLPIYPNIYTDQCEPSVIYHSFTLTGRYTTMQPALLTSWLQLLSYKV